MLFRRSLGLLAIALPLLAGCGTSSTASPLTTASPGTTASPVRKAHASSAAKMVADEAQEDIGKAIGVQPAETVKATWANNLWVCPYEYAQGTMRLSVKELSDPTDATSVYFNKLQHDLGWNKAASLSFVYGAFLTTNGSVVVRKDNLVLLVDVRSLPDQFGQPPVARSATAEAVAETIMGCWR